MVLLSTLDNCWKHCFPLDTCDEVRSSAAPGNANNNDVLSELEKTSKELNVNYTCVGIKKLLNSEYEDSVLEYISVEVLVEEIVSAEKNNSSQDVKSFQDEYMDTTFGLKDKLKVLGISLQLFEQMVCLTSYLRQYLLCCREHCVCRSSH